MSFIYQLSIRFYFLVARIYASFNEKAKLFVEGQKRTFPYLESQILHDKPIIWVHCASLGEFEQGRPLIEQIKNEYPDYRILLSFYSPSGYEVRQNYPKADYICYLPLDTPKNAKKFIDLVDPEKVFFIKYEYWYNYLRVLNDQKIPLYLVSAIFRPEQAFFKKGIRGYWYRKMAKMVTHFFVQNQQSVELLSKIGMTNCTLTGDTRFDRVAEIADKSKVLPKIEQFKNGEKLIVAGSTWQPDEALFMDYLKQNPKTKIIFVPHEVRESNIKRLVEQFPTEAIRYSLSEGLNLSLHRILVVDTVGLLSSIYRYATVAYVGGGFGVGIHNTLEAAIYNIPVLFGPNHSKFQEAVNLVKEGVAFPVSNSEELINRLNPLMMDEKLRENIATNCHKFMAQNLGATQQVLQKVFNIV